MQNFNNLVLCTMFINVLIFSNMLKKTLTLLRYLQHTTDDFNRVVLDKVKGDNSSDYINASFITVSVVSETVCLNVFISSE